MQFGKGNNLMKNWEDGELKFERPIKTLLQRGRKFVPRSKTSFKKESTQKDQEKGINALEEGAMWIFFSDPISQNNSTFDPI